MFTEGHDALRALRFFLPLGQPTRGYCFSKRLALRVRVIGVLVGAVAVVAFRTTGFDAGGEAPEEGCAEAVAPFVRACVNASDDGRGCAAAWRDRQVRCGALLRARHTTFAPDRPPARCKGI